MDKFIVSARKYRPQTFDTVVGQSHITTTLKNAIKNNQLAHAFLFCGPRGVGKTTCARILAKTINCLNLQPDGEACDTCTSCKSFNDGASLNIHELDAASNNSVDDIRLLVEQVRFAPQAGKYKIYIVDEVHMLSTAAFNAFLKTLEEPPSYAIFILATTEKHKIIPTILSRCQIFDFKRITNNDTAEHLQQIVAKEHIKADKAALQIIAQKSEGCMRDALSLLDKIVSFTNGEVNYKNTIDNLNILDHDYYFKILSSIQQQDLASVLLLFNEINAKGFEGDTVLNGFAEFLRNILVCKDAKAATLLDVVEGMQQKYITTANSVDVGFLIAALNILNDAEINYKMARNKKLHIEFALIKLNYLQQAITITATSSSITKKRSISTSPTLIKTKQIQSIDIAHTTSAKLLIDDDNKITSPKQVVNQVDAVIKQQPKTSSTPATIVETTPKVSITENVKNIGSEKRDLLSLLKEKAGSKYIIEEVKEAEVLSYEKLQSCVVDYIDTIKDVKGKTSTINNFKIAQIKIVDDITFKMILPNLTAQKTVELEKAEFIDKVKKQFNNLAINLIFEIDETNAVAVEQPRFINTKDKYNYLVEKYPLLKEFRETLKLDIG